MLINTCIEEERFLTAKTNDHERISQMVKGQMVHHAVVFSPQYSASQISPLVCERNQRVKEAAVSKDL